MKKLIFLLLSPFSQTIRCKYDLHDYIDSEFGLPWHFILHKCKKCGKKFYI